MSELATESASTVRGVSVTRDPFRMTAFIPEDTVSLADDGGGADWTGVWTAPVAGRNAIVLVSIAVTAFDPPPAGAAGEVLTARLRARHPEGGMLIEEFAAHDGNPALAMRQTVTQRVNGRDVTTGQAQALVIYAKARALGVVTGVATHPADLDRAAALVTGIAERMTVTAASAAA
ncbi:MAG TPA: hypothetical protein VHF26_21935 [Trebonia sp.]|nr:hypothetical protein [Trebonia sp.]